MKDTVMIEYPRKRITSVRLLYEMLEFNAPDVRRILTRKNNYYKEKLIPKDDGSSRTVYIVKNPLQSILRAIRKRILEKVRYPDYLHGSLRRKSPKTNATAHSGASSCVIADIESYYPSITWRHVFQLFHSRFRFSKPVSKKLAALITYNGELPQGSPVSSDVANLVLWGENTLFQSFAAKGYNCTRYMDDMVVSSQSALTGAELHEIKYLLEKLIKRNGFRVKKEKTKIIPAGNPIVITGLKPGPKGARISRKYFEKTEEQIRNLAGGKFDAAIIRSIRGKISHIKTVSPTKAKHLNGVLGRTLKTCSRK